MKQDHRLLVLILFATLIIASGWRIAKPDTQVSSYAWAEGKLVRRKDSKAGQGVPLAAGMSCPDIPPEAARFFNLPLPINRADQAALVALPGIGPKLAENILNYRARQGGITGPDDLNNVKGMGPKRLARLTPLLCFSGAEQQVP